jgi:hypothetical protein
MQLPSIAHLSRQDRFIVYFVATILIVRTSLLTLSLLTGFEESLLLPHYTYGSVLIVLAPLFRNMPLYAIGWGLLVDELMLFPTGATTWNDYFAPVFLFGTALLMLFVYTFRRQFVSVFRQ